MSTNHILLLALQREASGKSGLSARAKERSGEHGCLGIEPHSLTGTQATGGKVAQLSTEAAVGSNRPIRVCCVGTKGRADPAVLKDSCH